MHYRSAATKGYYTDDFIRYFVPKAGHRSPLINRGMKKQLTSSRLFVSYPHLLTGYFARVAAIDETLHRFIAAADGPVQIVSLGAGQDTTFFRLQVGPLASSYPRQLLRHLLYLAMCLTPLFPALSRRVLGRHILISISSRFLTQAEGVKSIAGYFEVDLPSVVHHKLVAIKRHEELLQAVGGAEAIKGKGGKVLSLSHTLALNGLHTYQIRNILMERFTI